MTLTEGAQISQIFVGVAVVFSLYFSIQALKRSEWQFAMATAPGIIIRPQHIWTEIKYTMGGTSSSLDIGKSIDYASEVKEISFFIYFECINAGRGTAFNLSKPTTHGLNIADEQFYPIPLHQIPTDRSFTIKTEIAGDYEFWLKITKEKSPKSVEAFITYNNDQGNVYCKSNWNAKIKPFEIKEGKLTVRRFRVLERNSKILYSHRPF